MNAGTASGAFHHPRSRAPSWLQSRAVPIDADRLARLYRDSGAADWGVAQPAFADALQRSVAKAFATRTPSARELQKYLDALHLTDLALAIGCAVGDDRAWDACVRAQRPALLRAADALDATGGAREIADALFAELFGLRERDGRRHSLFDHYHGRSSLATWLRAVLAQRYVDAIRAARRTTPLPDNLEQIPAKTASPDPDVAHVQAMVHGALTAAIAALPPRDRLRLACYYERQLNLAQTGRILAEHEATVSRQLARTRRAIRDDVQARLRGHGLTPEDADAAIAAAAADPGALDLHTLLRKNALPDRSI